MENKKQQQNLIETLKQNCRRIVKEKTGKEIIFQKPISPLGTKLFESLNK